LIDRPTRQLGRLAPASGLVAHRPVQLGSCCTTNDRRCVVGLLLARITNGSSAVLLRAASGCRGMGMPPGLGL
jgi:hypothetical protein